MADSRAPTIRLAILGHCRLSREALATYFAGQPGFVVVGHTSTIDGLAHLCTLTAPQIAVVEVDQLRPPTIHALVQLRHRHPGVEPVVIYTTLAAAAFAAAAEHGVTALVPGSAGLDAMSRAVRCRAGELSPPVGATGDGRALTERELAIASLIAAGHTTGDIAALLRISIHTVDNHRRRIYAKLGVDNQGAAVAQGLQLGIARRAQETDASRAPAAPRLTTREQEILSHIARGHTIRQTARELGVAAKTVENTQTRLYRKLGTHSRGEALAIAYRLGLIEPAQRS